MVHNVTSLSTQGLRDWLVQRVSAVVMTLYTFFIIGYLFITHFDYQSWQLLFQYQVMKIITLIVFLNLILHSWVGMWTVFTDYIDCTVTRICLEVVVALLLLSYFIWSVIILWG